MHNCGAAKRARFQLQVCRDKKGTLAVAKVCRSKRANLQLQVCRDKKGTLAAPKMCRCEKGTFTPAKVCR